MIVTDDRVIEFVSDRLNIGLFPPFTAMGIERGGQVIAGVVFNCFEGADVHVTIAGHGWNAKFLTAVGEYVFDQLKYERITIQTEKTHIVRVAERLGGQIEGLKRNHFGKGRDAFIVGILKEEYRFGQHS